MGTASCVLAITLAITQMACPARAQETSAANEGPLVPTPGEIRLEGTIEAIDLANSRLTLRATSFALPNGRSAGIAEPTLKTIQLSPNALLFARGAPEQKIPAQTLRVGWRAAATGRNEGGAKPFAARTVAVWTRSEDGQYRLDVEPAIAPPGAVPPAVAPPVAIAPVTVLAPALAAPVDVLENGGFEEQDDQLRPRGWTYPGGEAMTMVEDDDGNRFVQLRPIGNGDQRRIVRLFEVKPGWKSLKVSARVRARNFQLGANPWEDAHVGLVFINAAGEKIGYAWPVLLRADSDWVRRSGVTAIPPDAVRFEVDVGHFGSAGDFSVDDISVVPNAPLEGVPLRPNFPEGTFEDLDALGRPLNWSFDNTREIAVAQEGGNHFLRLSLPKEGYAGTDLFVQLEPGLRRVHVHARMRVQNIIMGKESWQRPRLGLSFADANGGKTGEWPASIEMKANSDWALQEQALEVPAGAAFLKLTPQLLNAGGTFDIDDIQITTDK